MFSKRSHCRLPGCSEWPRHDEEVKIVMSCHWPNWWLSFIFTCMHFLCHHCFTYIWKYWAETSRDWSLKIYSVIRKTLPKAQRTRGLSSTYQSNIFGSYQEFKHKPWSNIFRISTLHQLQNLNQTSPFRQNLNLKILTKPNQNLDQEWTS